MADRDDEIQQHREAIDGLDAEILARLNERARHAQAIGALKAGSGAPAWRPEREAQVLARLAQANAGPLTDEHVAGVFRQVVRFRLEWSVREGNHIFPETVALWNSLR